MLEKRAFYRTEQRFWLRFKNAAQIGLSKPQPQNANAQPNRPLVSYKEDIGFTVDRSAENA